jgi:hypothetical protein
MNTRAPHREILNATAGCTVSPNAVNTADFRDLSSSHISCVITAVKRMAIIVNICIHTRTGSYTMLV